MKVLYIKPFNSTFIKIDEEILVRNFETKVILLSNQSKKASYIYSVLLLCIYVLRNRNSIETVFTRFADYHTYPLAFLCKVFKIKFIVVVGGFEVAKIPELNYGAFNKKIRGFCVKKTFIYATKILPNTNKLIEYVNSFGLRMPAKGGILNFVPQVRNKITVVNNGFDSEKFYPNEGILDNGMILNVAIINNDQTFLRKGLDVFLNAAKVLPQVKFVQVGASKAYIVKKKVNIPQNVEFIEKTSNVLQFYQRAKVFFIPSRAEGMPNALCEAMLCGCIPVGSNVNAIPDIIANDSLVLATSDMDEVKSKLTKAIELGEEEQLKFRNRILSNYSIHNREKRLKNEIGS